VFYTYISLLLIFYMIAWLKYVLTPLCILIECMCVWFTVYCSQVWVKSDFCFTEIGAAEFPVTASVWQVCVHLNAFLMCCEMCTANSYVGRWIYGIVSGVTRILVEQGHGRGMDSYFVVLYRRFLGWEFVLPLLYEEENTLCLQLFFIILIHFI